MSCKAFNFNVGVLGHVDSGKTSLARVLSSTASTAAFDKNPQSRERGITLDLGFSAFGAPLPSHLRDDPRAGGFEALQVTLVDCPGHASLIRTIIGGAQIIDLMMLVIDVTKGMQTQSAECLLIGEITCPRMMVVLNKTDMLPEAKRATLIEKMTKKMHKTLENTRFKGAPIISVAAKPGGPDAPEGQEAEGIAELIELLLSQTYLPQRDPAGPLLMAVDHCFCIRGQGTVMTGTVLSGSVSVNDTVEIPALKVTKKVKSMQMFRKPVTSAAQGDRVGLCVTQFDPKLLERGLVCSPGSLLSLRSGIASVRRVPYFRGAVSTRAKFHVTIGHETVLARVSFFGAGGGAGDDGGGDDAAFDFSRDYAYQDEFLAEQPKDRAEQADERTTTAPNPAPRHQWALLEFERPVTCPRPCKVIASRLDADIHANSCRLAFHGTLLEGFEEKGYSEASLAQLRVYKTKSKEGTVERASGEYEVIGRSLFKKETNMQLFVGMKVTLSTGEQGLIEGGFGQSGKFKVRVPAGLKPETMKLLSAGAAGGSKRKGRGGGGGPNKEDATPAEEAKAEGAQPVRITLAFRKYVFDPNKKMVQA
ncbi:selenocysteine-specific elongation factor [Lethenteron reissneri]|uniref:selenocysteine-specific elongation factor n=1 Tax=Lethenteron reissneri TaxID=7753 RepID=UPI002AB66950|nr:selenocysteine-specific elongation factor [Lethenteron reissneri]